MRPRSTRLVTVLAAVLGLVVTACGGGEGGGTDRADSPNVVVIMTDDQTLAEMAYLPRTTELIGGQGATFANAFAVYPLCCPARATLLTGQYAHNTGVTDNVAPNGGENLDATTALPTWFQAAGYQTGLVGKYFNGYGTSMPAEVPPGWDDWFALLDPEGLRYFGASVIDNGDRVTLGEDVYTTDAIAERAVRDVERFSAGGDPFFLAVWTSAPHSGTGPGVPNPVAPAPAPRHASLYPNAAAPRGPAFFEADLSDKPPVVTAARDKINRTLVERGLDQAGLEEMIDVTWRTRARSLAAVDELVVDVVDALARSGELDRTIIVFTSDNGWMTGQHGVPFAKVLPYESSLRVPLMVRGPGITPGAKPVQPVGHHDVVPTLVAATGIEPAITMDGMALQGVLEDPQASRNRALLIQSGTTDESYQGIRMAGWTYVEWADGTVELYDLLNDPNQLDNAAGDPEYAKAQGRLADALDQLRGCVGEACLLEIPASELR